MKNVYLLSTYKEQHSIIKKHTGLLLIQTKESHFTGKKFNLYVTSEEEIKKGDWCVSLCEDESYEEIYKCEYLELIDVEDKKIILTTDQELIEDGVQEIDDEFLQWFVKNSSCESVEIKQDVLKLVHNPTYIDYTPEGDGIYLTPKSEDLQYGETLIEDNVFDYKIIIPIEDPKPHSFCETPEEKCTMNYCDENGCQNRKRVLVGEPKKEIIEETILENILEENYDLNVQFHKLNRECIFTFACAIYDEKLTFKEWEKKHYGNYIEQPKTDFVMKNSKHIPLENIHILQDAIGWLDNYKHSEEESHIVAINKFEKDVLNTDLLLDLGKINSIREKIIEQLYNNSINGNK